MNKINCLLISLVVFYLDYCSKQWIVNNFIVYEIKPIFLYLNFFYNRNYGIVFGLFSKKEGFQNALFAIISIIIIIFLVLDIQKINKYNKLKNFSYSLIIGGSLGNVFDRLNYGFVVDFIDLHFKNWHFATFNIADFSIFVGFIITIIDNLFENKKII